jgi:four helix bundle protein
MCAKENIIQQKSFEFALKIIDIYKSLNTQKEFIISKQLIKCGTSIGANIEEAIAAQSKKTLSLKCRLLQKKQGRLDIGLNC